MRSRFTTPALPGVRPIVVALQDFVVPPLAAAWECDLTDDSLRWSPGVFDLFGLDPTRRPDRCETVAMYEDESRYLLGVLRGRAIREHGSFTLDAWIRRADGERRRMRVCADVVVRDGRVTHLYGSKRDITPAAVIS